MSASTGRVKKSSRRVKQAHDRHIKGNIKRDSGRIAGFHHWISGSFVFSLFQEIDKMETKPEEKIAVSVSRDKVRCKLSREYMWTARIYHDGKSSSGFTRHDALSRLKRRIELEQNRKVRFFIQH